MRGLAPARAVAHRVVVGIGLEEVRALEHRVDTLAEAVAENAALAEPLTDLVSTLERRLVPALEARGRSDDRV